MTHPFVLSFVEITSAVKVTAAGGFVDVAHLDAVIGFGILAAQRFVPTCAYCTMS